MDSLENRVVRSILEKFEALPAKSKPRISPDGHHEWVPLSGIAMVRGQFFTSLIQCRHDIEYLVGKDVTCVSIGSV